MARSSGPQGLFDLSRLIEISRTGQQTGLYFESSGTIVRAYAADICHGYVMKLDDAAAHLEALGNPTRLKIYRILIRAGAAGLAVGRLQDKLKIAPSTLSHHIKALVTVGLVTQIREATTLVCHA